MCCLVKYTCTHSEQSQHCIKMNENIFFINNYYMVKKKIKSIYTYC